MNTVITHFYNEEYLLPWWINHHKKLFDYGIMINYASTDRSYEICNELCPPHWKIVDSVNKIFVAPTNDTEVKVYEQSVDGFKIALTVGEFLIVPNSLNHLNQFMKNENLTYIKTCGVCMVDTDPNNLPKYYKSLIEQKHHGMIYNYTDPLYDNAPEMYNALYGRFYHNDKFGKYNDGRHNLILSLENDFKIMRMYDVFTLKYKYSPWNDDMIKRSDSYTLKLKESDTNTNPIETSPLINRINAYIHFLTTAHDLTENINFKNAYNYCVNL